MDERGSWFWRLVAGQVTGEMREQPKARGGGGGHTRGPGCKCVQNQEICARASERVSEGKSKSQYERWKRRFGFTSPSFEEFEVGRGRQCVRKWNKEMESPWSGLHARM